jgi:hypothetical protein
MYRLNVLLIFATVYLGLHMVTGYLYCEDNFCPGDRESDYVYTVIDDDGKTWYQEDGKFMSEEEYKQAHANIVEFVKEDDNGTQK